MVRQLLVDTSNCGSWGPIDVCLLKEFLLAISLHIVDILYIYTHLSVHIQRPYAYSVRGRVHIFLISLFHSSLTLYLIGHEQCLLHKQVTIIVLYMYTYSSRDIDVLCC